MSNGISSRQNEEQSIAMLAAQRQLYNDAKAVDGITTALSVWIPFVLSILLLFIKQGSQLEYASYIVSIVSMMISIYFDTVIKRKKEMAASIQQKFDIYVYQMPWNDRLFGKNKNLNNEIARHSKKILSDAEQKSPLNDWYTSAVDEKELNQGILACQKENHWWDVGLRKRYRCACVLATIVLVVVVFGMGIVRNEDIAKLVWRIAFVGPMIEWFRDTVKQLNADIENLQEIDEMVNDSAPKTMDDLQDIQKRIYEHRKGCFTIPNFFYQIFKKNDEDEAHRAASMR